MRNAQENELEYPCGTEARRDHKPKPGAEKWTAYSGAVHCEPLALGESSAPVLEPPSVLEPKAPLGPREARRR